MAWQLGEQPIDIFRGGDDGGLYALNIGLDTYHWTINWDCRPRGTSVPAMAPIKFGIASGSIRRVESAIAWEETSSLVPFVLGAGHSANFNTFGIAKFKDGSLDGGFKAEVSTQRALRAVLYRNDGSDADAEVVWLCNGSGNEGLFELLKDGTLRNTSHTQKADGLAVIAGDLWSWSGYKIQKLTVDSDPGLTGSWQTAIPVGIPAYAINEVVDLGGSPVVLKGDGIFVYNPGTGEYDNLTPSVSPHADNGRGGFTDGRGRVYYPTVDGDMIVLTFGFQSQQKPTFDTTINRDTPWGQIGMMTADMEHVYAAVDPGATLTQDGVGLHIQEDNGGVFTNQTSDLTDRSLTTTDATGAGAWASLIVGDFIYIGADVPFWGIQVTIETVISAYATPLTTGTVQYSKSGGFQAAPVLFDGTDQLRRTGSHMFVFANADIFNASSTTPWIKSTINSVSKYWIRINFTSNVASLVVSEVKVAPYRPPLDFNTFPVTGQMLASCLTKILVGTWQGENLRWDDVWTLETAAVDAMAISRVGYTGGAGKRSLIVFTDINTLFCLPTGAHNDPLRQTFPKLADYSESGTAFDEHVVAFSGFAIGSVWRVNEGTQVEFPGIQSDDEVTIYYWWDNDAERVYKHELKKSQTRLPALEGMGKVLYMALAFKDGSRDEVAPQLNSVRIPLGAWEFDPDAELPHVEDQAAPIQR